MGEVTRKLNNERIPPAPRKSSRQQKTLASTETGKTQQDEIQTSVQLRQARIADKRASTEQMNGKTGRSEGNVQMKLVLPKQEVATIETKTRSGETKLEKRGGEKQRGEEARNTPLPPQSSDVTPPSRGEALPIFPLSTGEGKDSEKETGGEGDETEKRSEEEGQEKDKDEKQKGEEDEGKEEKDKEGEGEDRDKGEKDKDEEEKNKEKTEKGKDEDRAKEKGKEDEETSQKTGEQEQQQTKPPATQAGLPTGQTTPQDSQQVGETSEKERANALKSQKQQDKTAGQREAGKEKGPGERGKDKSRLKLPKEGSLTERAEKLAQAWMQRGTQQALTWAWGEVIFTGITFVGILFALIGYFYITVHFAFYYLGQMKSVFARPQTLLYIVGLSGGGLPIGGGQDSSGTVNNIKQGGSLLIELLEVLAWVLMTVFIVGICVLLFVIIFVFVDKLGWLATWFGKALLWAADNSIIYQQFIK